MATTDKPFQETWVEQRDRLAGGVNPPRGSLMLNPAIPKFFDTHVGKAYDPVKIGLMRPPSVTPVSTPAPATVNAFEIPLNELSKGYPKYQPTPVERVLRMFSSDADNARVDYANSPAGQQAYRDERARIKSEGLKALSNSSAPAGGNALGDIVAQNMARARGLPGNSSSNAEPPPTVPQGLLGPTGTGSITLGARGGIGSKAAPGTFWNTSGAPTGGFATNETNRQREEALVNSRLAYADTVQQQREQKEYMDNARRDYANAQFDVNTYSTMSPKLAMEYAIANNPGAKPVARQNSLAEVTRFNSGRDSAASRLKAAGDMLGLETNAGVSRYKEDQGLAGHKIAADAAVQSAGIAALGHQMSAQAKAAGSDVKAAKTEQLADERARLGVRNQTLNAYDWTGITPTAANEYASIMAKTFDTPGHETFSDPQSKYGDTILHPKLVEAFGPTLRGAKTSNEYSKMLAEIMRMTGGKGVYQTSIKNTKGLKPLKQAENFGLSSLNTK